MFGLGNELNAIIEIAKQFTLDSIEEKIETAKRDLASLQRQNKMITRVFANLKKNEERQEKRMAAWQKKQKAAMKKMPKFPTVPSFVGRVPVGVCCACAESRLEEKKV